MGISGTANASSVNASNVSTTILSADEITSGLAKINGTDIARFGNINRPNEPANTQLTGGV